jgi:prephenate dehydrogenase
LKIAILGLGLIGGSIGSAARKQTDAQVSGYDIHDSVAQQALELGVIDQRSSEIATAVRGAQAVFIATPVSAITSTAKLALAAADADCVLSDVGSTKRGVVGAIADQRFVGGHPLAGAESSGVAHARPELFQGACWYLTPTSNTSGVLYERLHRLLVSIGAQPAAIDAVAHDRLMACVSHLPHVFANLLVSQAAGALGQDGHLPATGPSFRDATRVAGANSSIWTDIYLSNRDALSEGIRDAVEQLQQVRAMLASSDAEAITSWNEEAHTNRMALLDGGTQGDTLHELRAAVPNRPGVIAEIALALGHGGVNIVDMALSPSEDNSQGVVALWVRGDRDAKRAEDWIRALSFPVSRV